jgi:glycosyltransferase involved in cell wall biosynthesis
MQTVTVIIANHNYGHFLADALHSCLNQTYKCNIAFVDDASTDNSWEVACKTLIGEFRPKQPQQVGDHVLIPLLQNVKQAGARNMGIKATWNKSDIYAVLDADDIMHNDKIEKCVDMLNASSQVGLVYADYYIDNLMNGTKSYEYKEPYDYFRLQQECIVHSGSVMKKQALDFVYKQQGYIFDETMPPVEDWDLWLRIAEGWHIMHIAEALTTVRVQQGSCTFTVSQETWLQQWQKIRQKQNERFKLRSSN